MTFYRRPATLTRLMNRAFSWFASLGVTPSRMITLEVKGRRSGEVRSTVVTRWSMRGSVIWFRRGARRSGCVRAAGGEAVIRHGGRQTVRLKELPAEERAPVIKKYLGENALSTRQHFGVDPKAELAEFAAIAASHPVFRIAPED